MSEKANPDLDPTLSSATEGEYKYGFTTDIDTDILPPGLTEDTVRFISKQKGEPEWLLEFRLKAFRYWLTLTPPTWAHLDIPPIDFQAISYWAAPKKKGGAEEPRRCRPAIARHLQPPRNSARGAEGSLRHGRGCGDGLRER